MKVRNIKVVDADTEMEIPSYLRGSADIVRVKGRTIKNNTGGKIDGGPSRLAPSSSYDGPIAPFRPTYEDVQYYNWKLRELRGYDSVQALVSASMRSHEIRKHDDDSDWGVLSVVFFLIVGGIGGTLAQWLFR